MVFVLMMEPTNDNGVLGGRWALTDVDNLPLCIRLFNVLYLTWLEKTLFS